MVNNSTDYYRENRRNKLFVHSCPHCSYCTHDSKITLTNHINSRHRNEEERPHQCPRCARGFAQKAHLIRHLECEHGIKNDITFSKISTLLYIISLTDIHPKSKKTKARCKYYSENSVIKSKDIHTNKHEYLPNYFLQNHNIHYDVKKGYVIIHKLALKEGYVIPIRGRILTNVNMTTGLCRTLGAK